MTRKFKSDIEKDTAQLLKDYGVEFEYESKNCKFEYVSVYTADFYLPEYNIWLECKGYHPNLGNALSKLVKVTKQNDEIELRMIWDREQMRVPFFKDKRKMTGPQWSVKNNIPAMTRDSLESWLQELTGDKK